MKSAPMSRRTWFRFTTRSLLAVVTAAAIPLWWLRRRLDVAEKQAEAVRKLEGLGVSISYRHEWDRERDCFSGAPTPGSYFLRAILGDHFFLTPDTIIVSEYNDVSSALAPIAELTTVTRMGVVDSSVGDEILPFVTPLLGLEELSLFGTQVTDEGIYSLADLQELRSLVVTKTRVTADGVTRFQETCPMCFVWTEKVEGFDENDPYHVVAVNEAGFLCEGCGILHTGNPVDSDDTNIDVDYHVMGNTVRMAGWLVEQTGDGWTVLCPKCRR